MDTARCELPGIIFTETTHSIICQLYAIFWQFTAFCSIQPNPSVQIWLHRFLDNLVDFFPQFCKLLSEFTHSASILRSNRGEARVQ